MKKNKKTVLLFFRIKKGNKKKGNKIYLKWKVMIICLIAELLEKTL